MTLRRLFVASIALSCAACRSPADTTPPPRVAVSRPAGAWEGRGSRSIGFISESGRFRVSWETRREDPAGGGTFRLTVRSAVSGRPIQVVADQQGIGRGTADVADDPRPYDFVVDSVNVEWAFSVEEIVSTPAAPAPPKP